jgi:hypothetical protein
MVYSHEEYLRHKEKYAAYRDRYRKEHPGLRQKEYQNARTKLLYQIASERLKLLEILGNKCVRCSQTDPRVLQFDHIDGDGKIERRNRSRLQIVRYYLKHIEEAKKKLQILCPTCNVLKVWENNEQPYFKRRTVKTN